MKLDDSRGAGSLRDAESDGTDCINTRDKALSVGGVGTTAHVTVEQLAAVLAAKETELKALQQTHDEYVRSSCEVEKELEGEVERVEKKLHAMELQLHTLEEAKRQLHQTHSQMQMEVVTTRKREEALVTQVQEMKWKIQRLEQTNDELETATRVAQASIDELQHKVETLVEENVFLQQEKEEEGEEPPPRDDSSTCAPNGKRRSGRAYPEVVESCLHITCQCHRPAAPAVKNPPKKSGFFHRLRRRLSLS